MPAKAHKQWFLYIVSCSDQSLYTGICVDIVRRIAAHNAGIGARYTRSHRPVRLVYTELCENHSSALKREAVIKRLSRSKKLQLCTKHKLVV